jgi:hypothetical protein
LKYTNFARLNTSCYIKMSIINKFDQLSYYYTLEYYLYEQELDFTVLDYLNNNNIEIGSLICFFDIIKNNIHYIITTNEDNSHKLITISKCDVTDNSIINSSIIFYNGYKFTIFNDINLVNVEALIGITDLDVNIYRELRNEHLKDNKIRFEQYNILTAHNTNRVCVIKSLRILSILTCCTCAYLSVSMYCAITSDTIAKFNMKKLFPNLEVIYGFQKYIIYRRDD